MKRLSDASIVNIPSGDAFLDRLASRLITYEKDPLALARILVLLPTRRACRALQHAFLRVRDGKPSLLPRIQPLGEPDPLDIDSVAFEESADSPHINALDIPPAISPFRRQVLLARLIMGWRTDLALDQALQLAQDLARLMDEVLIEGIDLDRLRDLVPEDLATHWQITLDFLAILTTHWPRILVAEGALDPADRRNRLLRAQAKAWSTNPPSYPIIAAGSTGSIPATADLLSVIRTLPYGQIVLAGLDRHALTEDGLHILAEPTHPQHNLARLLQKLEVTAKDIPDWPADDSEDASRLRPRLARQRLLQETFRPAPATERWRELQDTATELRTGLEGMTRIDCPGAEEEASVIALLMREVLETPGKTAALVTPDRTLARRVSAALKRWKLEIDDSAGRPLAATPAGTFLRLGALALAEALSPVSLLAVLKHPLACGGKSGGAFKYAVRRFERDLLRGPRPAPGIDGLEATLTAANFDPQIEKAHRKFIQDLAKWAAPFLNISVQDKTPLRDLIRAHLYFLEGLAADDQNPGASRLWSGNDGDAIQSFIAELLEIAPNLPPLPVARYPALLNAFLTGRVIRPLWGSHPRLFVWGPLEARLQHADRIILGGLNEGTWPAEPMADPWLSRPMRLRMGLPPATRRIGQAAHDFATASHNPEIFFTRATRVDGTPTVPSRWLLRLESVLTAAQLKEQMQTPLLQDPRWLAWQVKIDTAKQTRHLTPPAPCPPIAARPRRLSVTEIETWRRDPYAIYARRILRLEKLDELDAKLMANTYGTLVHDILDRFLHLYPDTLPADADAQLMKMGENIFGSATARPHVWGFWRPRFQRIARWFIAEEQNRRMNVKKIHSEIKGELVLGSGDHTFTLSAKVDRIDELVAGGLTIIDYKTGSYPKPPEVEAGFSPQLPLEAMMAMHGAFAAHGIPATTQIAALEYWHLPGNNAIPGSVKSASKNKSPDLLAREALDGLTGLIAVFDDPTTPYLARPYPKYAPDFSNYTHLSRMAEWSLEEDKGDDL